MMTQNIGQQELALKRIFLQPAGRMHSAFREMMAYPPEGYTFVTRDSFADRLLLGFIYNDFVFHHFVNQIVAHFPLHIIRSYFGRVKKTPDNLALTYACGHVVLRNEPWVVELEWAYQLAGFSPSHFQKYKDLIERRLSSDHCKKIICMTDLTQKTIRDSLNAAAFEHKLETVYRTVRKKDFVKSFNEHGKTRILFVGSANIPEEFDDEKGGRELIEAIELLNRRFSNLEFIIRSDVPPKTKRMCRNLANVKLIDHVVPWPELEKEFKSADIALLPAHHTPSLAFLDAMSYEMPVVTIDSWANKEIVEDGKTGFVVSPSNGLQLPVGGFLPSGKVVPVKKGARAVDLEVVHGLVEKMEILVEDKGLRRMMGKAARYEVEQGKFSMEKRRQKLKRIFDEATA